MEDINSYKDGEEEGYVSLVTKNDSPDPKRK